MEQTRNKGRWFKLAEAAQQLGVSEITVRRKAKSGHLKAILRNGRYMVFLEENEELGMFTAALDEVIPQRGPQTGTASSTLGHIREKRDREVKVAPAVQDELIQSLKRTIEDQQTLISSLEASISRLSQKLADGRYSNK
jgi:uncharacterized coiled-coil protein SlyX